jgi:hypothetical protein
MISIVVGKRDLMNLERGMIDIAETLPFVDKRSIYNISLKLLFREKSKF